MTMKTLTETSAMPVWLDQSHLDMEWLLSKLGGGGLVIKQENDSNRNSVHDQPYHSVHDISNEGRRGTNPREGATLLLDITTPTMTGPLQSCGNEISEQQQQERRQVVLKQVPLHRYSLSQQLGLAREALFYKHVMPQFLQQQRKKLQDNAGSSTKIPTSERSFSSFLPEIYYAHGDMDTGESCILMEALSVEDGWFDSGIFFGPGNPNNWNRDLPTLLAQATTASITTNIAMTNPPTAAAMVAKASFCAMAQIHATFWKRTELFFQKVDDEEVVVVEEGQEEEKETNDNSNENPSSYGWLRGYAWLQGQGQESWEASQGLIQRIWQVYLEEETTRGACDGMDGCWNPIVRAAVEKAVSGISWEAQRHRLHVTGKHWTLVHGDFWPGNVMFHCGTHDGTTTSSTSSSTSSVLKLLDWEMVGLGSGPQDLGQYVISNMDPVERRACEHELLKAYYDELVKSGVPNNNGDDDDDDDDDLWEYCWKEYTVGGVERWLWFLIYFLGQPTMQGWAKFFHDQIAAFMMDHELTEDDITQPRP